MSDNQTPGGDIAPPEPVGPGAAPKPARRAPDNRDFVLRYVQPGLSELMDGSVSTLAPIFAVALLTKTPYTAFIVGLSAAVGAGISMAFAEALSDDGSLTGRGSPVVRGAVTGS